MRLYVLIIVFCVQALLITALNLQYLNPLILQTKTSNENQEKTSATIIEKYTDKVEVKVSPSYFVDNKDSFELISKQDFLIIKASSGVAALWGFNYYLKKYCNSHIGWQVKQVNLPDPLPDVNEKIVANDRFRVYGNANVLSYSHVWWNTNQWKQHVEWMAMNGINLALAPVAQEAAWARVYQKIGMTQDEIDEHFTAPGYLPWHRYGNVHGWEGPLFESWHNLQRRLQSEIVEYMNDLGMIPIFPAFNGHVPKSFSRIFADSKFHTLRPWCGFSSPKHCCSLFVDPGDALFKIIGKMFLKEIAIDSALSSVYNVDPFIQTTLPITESLVTKTAKSIFATLLEVDDNAVWIIQNWNLVDDKYQWRKLAQSYLTSVPNGRILILDMHSEQFPQYDEYDMYYGQPFIWNMMHSWAGHLGMFGSAHKANLNVYKARMHPQSTMVGMGITPAEINNNYVMYEFILETAWRKEPVQDLELWGGVYAERRYGCNATAKAWKHLMRSVYNYNGGSRLDGQNIINSKPTLSASPWVWYDKDDLFEAFKNFVFVTDTKCYTRGYYYDLVDVTTQSLLYRAQQLYNKIKDSQSQNFVLRNTIKLFLEILKDIETILASHDDFSISDWLSQARSVSTNPEEIYKYEMNARSLITTWLPFCGMYSDYAGKQWAELYHYYYIPRWQMFLEALLETKGIFSEINIHEIIAVTVERTFLYQDLKRLSQVNSREVAEKLYKKWAYMPILKDLKIEEY